MGAWHRENPELVGTSADPWMRHDSYANALRQVKDASGDYCRVCGEFLLNGERGVCSECKT